MSFTKNDMSTTFKRKDYGTMNTNEPTTPKFGFKNTTDFSRPEFISTKKYQRLEDSPKLTKTTDSNTLKRSLLPNSRKLNVLQQNNNNNSNIHQKNLRDSFNSSGSNNSNQSNVTSRNSPMHIKTDSNSSHLTLRLHSKTPPKFIHFGPATTTTTGIGSSNNNVTLNDNSNNSSHNRLHQPSQMKSSLPLPNSPTSSLPPKPVDNKSGRRGSSLSRNGGENRYRIQF